MSLSYTDNDRVTSNDSIQQFLNDIPEDISLQITATADVEQHDIINNSNTSDKLSTDSVTLTQLSDDSDASSQSPQSSQSSDDCSTLSSNKSDSPSSQSTDCNSESLSSDSSMQSQSSDHSSTQSQSSNDSSTFSSEKSDDISPQPSVTLSTDSSISSDDSCSSTFSSRSRKNKTLRCTYCGTHFRRSPHLRGPHPDHEPQCPRHPDNYTVYNVNPSTTQYAEQGGDIMDCVDGADFDGEIPSTSDGVTAPASGAGWVDDDGLGDISDGILLRTDKIILREIEAKQWSQNLKNISYRVYFKQGFIGGNLKDMTAELYELFTSIFENLDFLNPQDQVRVFIDSKESLSVPILVGIRPWCIMDVETVMSEVKRKVQSREQVLIGSDFSIDIGIYRPISGGTSSRPLIGNFKIVEQMIKKSDRSYIYIQNDDLSCLPQSILFTYLHSIKLSDANYIKNHGIMNFEHSKTGTVQDRLEKVFRIDACSQSFYKYIIARREKGRTKKAVAWFLERCNLPNNVMGTVNDIPSYEEALNRRVHIMTVGDKYGFITEPKDISDKRASIYILLNHGTDYQDGHFHGVKFISNVFGKRHFCHVCAVAYDVDKGGHQCKSKCFACGRSKLTITRYNEDAVTEDDRVEYCISEAADITHHCRKCNGFFQSESCYTAHSKTKNRSAVDNHDSDELVRGSWCQKYWYCNDVCKKRYLRKNQKDRQHVCFEYYCKRCCIIVESDSHRCHLQPNAYPKRKATLPERYIYFDVEVEQSSSSQCEQGYKPNIKQGCTRCHGRYLCPSCRKCCRCASSWCQNEGSRKHRPVFIAAKTMCTLCFDPNDVDKSMNVERCDHCAPRCESCINDKGKPCLGNGCCIRDHTWSGPDCIQSFGDWLFNPRNKNAIGVCHNLSTYDGYFLMSYLVKKGTPPKMVFNGNKLITARDALSGVRLIDSLLFIPLPLRKMPETFGLDRLMKKGYFAHFYSTMNNLHYIGNVWPSPDDYGCDGMSSDEREKFFVWYNDILQSGVEYNHFDQLSKYCINDVHVLASSCMSYTCLMLDLVGIAPFTVATTLASLALKIFRIFHLRAQYKLMLTDGREIIAHKRGTDIYTEDTQTGERLETFTDDEVINKTFVSSDVGYLNRGRETGHHVKYSKESLEWLSYRESLLPPNTPKMRSVLHPQGEYRIPGPVRSYSLDGYVPGLDIILEFLGCIWHGCMQCHADVMDTRRNPLNNQTMRQLQKKTVARRKYITETYPHYVYVEIWECQWKK